MTAPHSDVLTGAVLATARAAGDLPPSEDDGGGEGSARQQRADSVVFCLLVVARWFRRQALLELWDAELHALRALACEALAKRAIEGAATAEPAAPPPPPPDDVLRLERLLLTRFSTLRDGRPTRPANAIEMAIDMHALRVIASSGFQRTIGYIWRGWLVQDDEDPSRFVRYERKAALQYCAHWDVDRIRVPVYQNWMQIAMSIVYLALYSQAINTVNPTGDLDVIEGLLYMFTLGFMADEVSKLWKIGWAYLQFWNMFNASLYVLLLWSFVLRMVAMGNELHHPRRHRFNELSYYFLACTAPLFWGRLLLYLSTLRFFGAMTIVVSRMMRESAIFFAMLLFIMLGFMQAFIGLNQTESNVTAGKFVFTSMINAIMTSPNFEGFDNYAVSFDPCLIRPVRPKLIFQPPFGLILYYIYTFLVMVILLNVLIALYSSAYSEITENATDEYLALVSQFPCRGLSDMPQFAQKALQFVRAPDENVFIPRSCAPLACQRR